MTRRADLKEMRDCKVIPGEEVVSQRRLLCAVLRTKQAKHSRRAIEKKGRNCGRIQRQSGRGIPAGGKH